MPSITRKALKQLRRGAGTVTPDALEDRIAEARSYLADLGGATR